MLLLDGIENAERNVLPTLNNLLENREMFLDDGSFLMPHSHLTDNKVYTETATATAIAAATGLQHQQVPQDNKIITVHPNFRVIALGHSCPPYIGRPLDPPLRSRFQCRFIDELSTPSLLQLVKSAGLESVRKSDVQMLAMVYEVR